MILPLFIVYSCALLKYLNKSKVVKFFLHSLCYNMVIEQHIYSAMSMTLMLFLLLSLMKQKPSSLILLALLF